MSYEIRLDLKSSQKKIDHTCNRKTQIQVCLIAWRSGKTQIPDGTCHKFEPLFLKSKIQIYPIIHRSYKIKNA